MIERLRSTKSRTIMSVIGLLVVSLFASLLVFKVARADDKTFILNKDEVHKGLLAKANESVRIDGEVQGDLWVAGSDVEITGPVRGSVYAAASKVRISGTVEGNVHAFGSEVSLNGVVKGSAYVAGSDVALQEASVVERTAGLAGSKVLLKGGVGGQAFIAGSQTVVSGKVGQGLRASSSDLTLENTAYIGGDLHYTSPIEAKIANDKAIAGRVIHDTPPSQRAASDWRDKVRDSLLSFIVSVVTAAVVLALWGHTLVERAQLVRKLPARIFGRGLLFILVVPIIAIFALITIVGAPVGLILSLLYIVVLMLAPTAAGLLVGLQFTQNVQNSHQPVPYFGQLQAAVLGLLALAIVSFVPLIGALVSVFAYVAGVGVITASHLTIDTPLKKK